MADHVTAVVVSEAFRRESETFEMVTVGAVESLTIASYPVRVTDGAVALAAAFPILVITVNPEPGVALIVAEVQFPKTTLVEGLELIEPPVIAPDEAIIVPDRVEAVPAPVVTAELPWFLPQIVTTRELPAGAVLLAVGHALFSEVVDVATTASRISKT